MMQCLLNKLQAVINNSSEADIETYEGLRSRIIVNEGASEQQIDKCISYFGRKLPDDYLSFLRNYNGCTFFKGKDIGGFQFWDCDELIYQNKFHKENLGGDWDERIILICVCLGDGDYLGIKILQDDSYEVLDCFGEEIPSNWNSIGNSYSNFLE